VILRALRSDPPLEHLDSGRSAIRVQSSPYSILVGPLQSWGEIDPPGSCLAFILLVKNHLVDPSEIGSRRWSIKMLPLLPVPDRYYYRYFRVAPTAKTLPIGQVLVIWAFSGIHGQLNHDFPETFACFQVVLATIKGIRRQTGREVFGWVHPKSIIRRTGGAG